MSKLWGVLDGDDQFSWHNVTMLNLRCCICNKLILLVVLLFHKATDIIFWARSSAASPEKLEVRHILGGITWTWDVLWSLDVMLLNQVADLFEDTKHSDQDCSPYMKEQSLPYHLGNLISLLSEAWGGGSVSGEFPDHLDGCWSQTSTLRPEVLGLGCLVFPQCGGGESLDRKSVV